MIVPDHKAVIYMGKKTYMWGLFVMDWRKKYPSCKSVIINDSDNKIEYIMMPQPLDANFMILGYDTDMDFETWSKKYMLRVIFEQLDDDELYKTYDREGVLFVYDESPDRMPIKANWAVLE